MTHIPGTEKAKTKTIVNISKPEQKGETKIIAVYKKENKVQKKIGANSIEWYMELKYWLRVALGGSFISFILGLLIYKSFFVLAIFIPIAIIGIWYLVRLFEETISRFDSFSK